MSYNPAVQFSRPNYALQTLVAELRAKWGNPTRTPEFITGYKAPNNATGHNPDSNGIVHGVDLFFSNNSPWNEARGIELAEWLRTVEVPRGQTYPNPQRAWYIIYRDHLAGPMSGYKWTKRPDGSGYQHWDHIHISTTDLLWGSPIALPAADYDSRAPWGVGSAVTTQGNTTTPAEKDEDMPTVFTDSAVGDGKVWVGNSILRRHITSEAELADMQKLSREGIAPLVAHGKVHNLPIGTMGVDVAELTAHAALHTPFPYVDPETGRPEGQTTTAAVALGAQDFQHAATRREG